MYEENLRIVVVEDDPGHAELLLRSFDDAPEFAIALTDTIKAARSHIMQEPPDLVLTDYLLPDGAGKEVLEILPERYPVVVMTSHGSEQIAVELMKAGALDYIVKTPDSFDQMPHIVRRAVREWRLRCEHQKAQNQLAAINAELEQRIQEEVSKNLEKDRLLAHQTRLAAMGEMLRDIAHQWRQPLNSIALIVQSIGMEFDAGELNRESLQQQIQQTLTTVSYLSDTINLFRNFYQPEQAPAPFSLKAAVESAIAMLSPGIEAGGIRLSTDLVADRELVGYRNEFVNAVINIMNNAREAILEQRPEKPAIRIRLYQNGHQTLLTISDNGGGVPDAIRDKIFDPYFTTKFKSQGTGIGLYMVQTIIESSMGGSITFRNQNGGAEFTIAFPLVSA